MRKIVLMKICKKCVQPDTRPNLYFDDNGVCGACIWEEEKKQIDWNAREKELMDIANWAKETTKSNYDCAIGISGGKDSTLQALVARDKLGLRCLLVNSEPEGITDLGRHNIENLKNLGFDVVSMRPNPKIIKKLMKRDFYKYLNPVKITEYSLWSSVYIVAEKFDIPLIIQGENTGLTIGTSLSGLGTDSNALKANQTTTMSSGWHEYLEVDGVEEKDLYLFHYDRNKLEEKGIRGIWLQYYFKEWSFRGNAEFSKKHGLKWRENFDPNSIGAYMPFAQLDTDLTQVNQMLKYIKFGFGQCVDHTCYDIRDGLMTRDKAIEVVKEYDGKCAPEYITKFCDYLEITLEEFWKVTNSFRGLMWEKDQNNNWHNTFFEILEKSRYVN